MSSGPAHLGEIHDKCLVGSASSGMKIIHVNVIRWAGLLEWAGNYHSTHVQIILAPSQFFTYELTLANSSISMQNARIPDNFAISKEIKKDSCDIYVELDLFTIISFLSRRVRIKTLEYLVFKMQRSGCPT